MGWSTVANHALIARSAAIVFVAAGICLTSCTKADRGPSALSGTKSEIAVSTVRQQAEAKTMEGQLAVTELALKPAVPHRGDVIEVRAESNDTSGSVEFGYRWSVNDDEVFAATDPVLKTTLKKGDTVSVHVTPMLGGVEGLPASRSVQVVNSPPSVKPDFADIQIKGNGYSFRVQAEDPDGDKLTYSLLSAPSGMMIDPATGVISGEYSEAIAGNQKVKVSVKDSDNAEVQVEIPINIGFSKPTPTTPQ